MMTRAKRKRTNSQSVDSPSKLRKSSSTRSTELYLEDGNIVLIAEDVAFRVHKSQLARHSEVFRDMFACANPPGDSEIYDGCQVVRLSDKSDEISALLRALYDFIPLDYHDIPLAVDVFRMSNKYAIERLSSQIMKHLGQFYPDTLNAWDALDLMAPEIQKARGFPHYVMSLVNADLLLPAAYYDLCCYTMKEALDPRCCPTHLVATYCMGKEEMTIRSTRFIRQHFVDRKECSKDGCNTFRTSLAARAQSLLWENIAALNSLRVLLALSQDRNLSSMCRECRTVLKNAIKTEREAIWTSLPETFGLGSWEELRKKDSKRVSDSPTQFYSYFSEQTGL